MLSIEVLQKSFHESECRKRVQMQVEWQNPKFHFLSARERRGRDSQNGKNFDTKTKKEKKWLSQYFYIPMMNGPGVGKTTYQTNYGNEKSLNIATVLNNCHKETYITCIFYCLLVVCWVWNWMGWNVLIENKFLFIKSVPKYFVPMWTCTNCHCYLK